MICLWVLVILLALPITHMLSALKIYTASLPLKLRALLPAAIPRRTMQGDVSSLLSHRAAGTGTPCSGHHLRIASIRVASRQVWLRPGH